MKDMRTTKIMLAVCMVALMLAVAVVPATQGPTDADATVTHKFSDHYMYVITLDGTSKEKISDVQVSVNGTALTSQKSYDGTNKGVSHIKKFWKFDSDTGLGPFNSFYAAVNLTSGTEKIGNEDKIASGAGQIAFVLNPNNLKLTMGGTNLTDHMGEFNIMLIIPTVYWKASDDGTKLYISNSASYTVTEGEGLTVEDMVAYAHIANTGVDGVKHVTTNKTPYPYIGIGVYEASLADGKLYSQTGKTPAVSATNDAFVGYAKAQPGAAKNLDMEKQSAYQQWNFYQWTLYKIMSYSVMGTKNSQQMIGNGYVNASGSQTTGNSDSLGAYYGTSENSTTVSKLFIENFWGSVYEFVGDTCFSEMVLYTGNTLGGETIGTGSSHSGKQTTNYVKLPSSNWISETSKASATWDLPTTSTSTSNATSMDVPGDYVYPNTGWRSFCVGGGWNDTSAAGVARAYAHNGLGDTGSLLGARLAYVMTADAAVGLADTFKIQSRWTVNPAGVADLVYNGADQALATAGTVNGGTPKYSLNNTDWSTSVPSAADAGTYTVYYKIEANADYKGLAAQSLSVTVSKKPLANGMITINGTYTYNGSNQTVSFTNSEGAKITAGDYTLSGNTGTNAGGYTLTLTAKDGGNYSGSASKGWTIQKADSYWAVPPAAISNLEYNGSAQDLITAGTASGGTAYYKVGSGEYGTSVPQATNAGTFTVYYKITGDSNHNDRAEQSLSATIGKKVLTLVPFIAGWTYGSSASTPSVTGNESQAVSYQYKVRSAGEDTYVSTVPTDANNYTMKVTLDANANYEAEARTVDFAIAAKPVTITGVTAQDKVYDGSTTATPSGTPVVSGKIGSDDVTVSAGTASFADANAGSGKAVTFAGYQLAGTKASNYSLSAQPASTTASISARPISVSWEYPANLTYSGIAKVCTPSIANKVGGDTVAPTSVLSAGKDAVNVTADGFTYEVTGLTGSSKFNYTLAGATGLTSDTTLITKAQFTVAPKENLEISKTYDGTQIVTKIFSLSDFVISSLQNGEQLASVSITALYDGAMPGPHDVEITQMTFAAADMSPSTSYVASNYDIIVNGNQVWGDVGVKFIIPASAYVLILPSGGGGGDLEFYTVTTDYAGANLVLTYSNKIVKGAFGILSVTPSKNYGYTGLTVTNGTLSRLADDCYIINPDDDLEAEAVLRISVAEQALEPSGMKDIHVTGIIGSGHGAQVLIQAAGDGGLKAGTVTIKGVCYSNISGRTVYSVIDSSNVKLLDAEGQKTSSATATVAAGDREVSKKFAIGDNEFVYYVYAEYYVNEDYAAMDSPGVIAPVTTIAG
jgi:hypothetical protein